MIGDVIMFYLAENVQPRRPRARGELGEIPAQTDSFNVELTATAHGAAQRRRAQGLSLSDPGPAGDEDARDGAGPRAGGPEVLQHGAREIAARTSSRFATARPASRAGNCSVPWEDQALCARRWSKPAEIRHEACRRPRLRSNALESGWSPAAARHLHRRRDERLPRWLRAGLRGVASLGGSYCRRHRGLLPDAVGPRLRPPREVRPRFHRPRGAGENGRRAAPQKVTLALDNEDVTRAMGSMLNPVASARSSSSGRTPCTRCTRTTTSRSTERRSASRPGSATAPTRASC